MRDHLGRGDRAGFEAALERTPAAARRQGSRRRTGRRRRSCRRLRSTGAAAISTRSPFSTATAPSAPRVMTSVRDIAGQLARVQSASSPQPVRCRTSSSLPNRMSTVPASIIPAHAFAAVADAQALGQGEGDRAARLRARSRAASSIAARGPLGAPQIAFEEGDAGRADQLRDRAQRASARGSRRGRCSSSAARRA